MLPGYLLAATCILVWGITFVCTKSLLQDFSALEILFYRFSIAYIGLWAIHPKWEKIAFKDNLLYALAGLSGVVLYQFSENVALSFTTASNVSVIVSICPLFTAILSQIIFKEKHINTWFILGFILCICGITLVSLNGKTSISFNPKGDLLALGSAICWSLYSMLVSQINKKNYDSLCSTRRTFFFAVIFMLPLIFIGTKTGQVDFAAKVMKARISNPMNWFNILFLGLLASGFCFWAWSKACSIVGTVKVTGGLYIIPVVTIIFAFLFLGEKITSMGAAGALITIIGLFVSGFKRNPKNN